MRKNLKKTIALAVLLSIVTIANPIKAMEVSKRLYGTNRIETAINIAKEISPSKLSNIILVSGENFPDGLSASVLAKKLNAPILLTGTLKDSQSVFDFMKANADSSTNIYVIGGTGVIGVEFENKIKELGLNSIKRISGSDRFDTCQKVDDELNIEQGTPIVVASGENFPDALSISSIAAAKGYPVVLASKDSITSSLVNFIKVKDPSKIYIIGGPGVVSDNVKKQIQNSSSLTDENIIRLFGNDRYDTSLAIAKHFNLSSDTVTFSSGKNFPDALAGSVYAANKNASVLLVDKESIANQKMFIDQKKYSNKVLFGGEASISLELEKIINSDGSVPLSDMEKDWREISSDVPRRLYSYPYTEYKSLFYKNNSLQETILRNPVLQSRNFINAKYNIKHDEIDVNKILYFYNPYIKLSDEWPENTVNNYINDVKKYKISSTAEFITDKSLVYSADYNMICRGTMKIKFDNSTDQGYLDKYGLKAGQWYEKDLEVYWQILAFRKDDSRPVWNFTGESITKIKDLSGFMPVN